MSEKLNGARQPEKPAFSAELETAIRKELLSVIEQPMTPASLMVLSKMVEAARELIIARVGDPQRRRRRVGSIAYNNPFFDGPEEEASSGETFGAHLVRELVAAVPRLMERQQPQIDPVSSLIAINYARSNGMGELADKLEQKLVKGEETAALSVAQLPKAEAVS